MNNLSHHRYNFVWVLYVLAMVLLVQQPARADDRFQDIFDGHNSVMLIIDPDSGAIIRANDAAAAFYGYPASELQNMQIQQINLLTPEQVAAERELALTENRNFFIFRHKTANDDVKTVEVYARPILYNGKSLLFSIIHDISDKKTTEKTLIHYKNRLEEMVDIQSEELETQFLAIIALLLGGVIVSLLLIIKLKQSLNQARTATRKATIETSKLNDIIHATSAGTWEYCMETDSFDVNVHYAEMLGYDIERLTPMSGDHFWRIVHPKDADHVKEAVDTYVNGNSEMYECEFRMKHADGQWIWVLDRGRAIDWDEKKRILRLAGTHNDITKIKESEISIIDNSQRLEQAERVAKIGNWSYQLNDRKVTWSDGLWRIFEREPVNNLDYQIIREWIHPSSLVHFDSVMAHMLKIKPGEKIDDFIFNIVTPDNQIKSVEIFLDTRFAEGKPILLFGAVLDVTERKAAERHLLESEQRFRDFSRSSSDWFWEMDANLRFSYFSRKLEDIAGVSGKDMLGKTRKEIGIADVDQEHWQAHFDALEHHQEFRDFIYSMGSSPNKFWLSISGVPVFDNQGIFCGYRGTGKNITSQIEATRRLAKATEEANAANKAKSEFLASTSHELRTPMTTVMGFCDLLLDSDINESTRENVDRIRSATTSLLDIVNDILDMSKLEEGKMALEHIDFDLRDLLQNVYAMFSYKRRASNESVDWTIFIEDSVPQFINSDPTRVRQILVNLLGNAQKFTHKGEIAIGCRLINNQPDQSMIEFSVRDTGIGMSKEAAAAIFDKFIQADASISRKYEGTGLGLAICKRLTGLLGGEIQVKSEEGKGSTFVFTIPFEAAQSGAKVTSKTPTARSFIAARPLHILLAEDNRVNQLLIKKVLGDYGHDLEIANNGLEAVTALQEQDFDLILMDVRMPEMDGTEAARIIRNMDGPKAQIPIIAATADAVSEHVQEYFNAGMNAYVSKPFDWARLALTINQVMDEDIHIAKPETK